MILEPIRRTLTIRVPPADAFAAFVALSAWWPAAATFAHLRTTAIVLEGRHGGRWLERSDDGAERLRGRVHTWEPPADVILTWQVSAQAPAGPGPFAIFLPEAEQSRASIVHLAFRESIAGLTDLDLSHYAFERHGGDADAMRERLDGPIGWDPLLRLYVAHAESTVYELR